MKKLVLLLLLLVLGSFYTFGADKGKVAIERATILEIIGKVPAKTDEVNYAYKTRLILKIESGDNSPRKVIMEHPKLKNTQDNLNIVEKDSVIVKIEDIDGILYYTIVGHNRLSGMIWIAVILLIVVVVVGKREGIKFVAAALLNIGVLFFVLIPLIIKGISPLIITYLFSMLLAGITIFLINGKNKKSKVAIISTALSITVTLIVCMVYNSFAKLSGFSIYNVDSLFEVFKGIKVDELLFAGIMIGFTGVIASITSIIASAMENFYKSKERFYKNEIFNTGIAAGRELFFILMNTLIIAYIGSTLFMLVLLMIQSNNTNILIFINSELFIEEFIRNSIAAIGLALSIPITAFIGEKTYNGTQGEE